MSTDQTPALARATDALHPYWSERYPSGSQAGDMAKDAVSATLHDPDKGRDPVAEALCSHDESVHHMERTDDFPCSACVSAADAVRAAILGADQ